MFVAFLKKVVTCSVFNFKQQSFMMVYHKTVLHRLFLYFILSQMNIGSELFFSDFANANVYKSYQMLSLLKEEHVTSLLGHDEVRK